jgi:hypothetical protein
MRQTRLTSSIRVASSALFLAVISGCSHGDSETTVSNPYARSMSFAVAPILNFSGEPGFDPIKAADLLASELTYVEGVTVLPVSRVVALLATQGRTQIESPAHAIAVADAVGADAIFVAGISEYDAYTPVIGLVIQVYAVPRTAPVAVDPVHAERMAQPITLRSMADATLPRDQIQMVYNGTHSNVTDSVKKYAAPRSEQDSPLGWREYVKVQTLFLRFCWHDAIDRLMRNERWRHAVVMPNNAMEYPL